MREASREYHSNRSGPVGTGVWPSILWIASIALTYFIVARFSLSSFLFEPEGIAAIWPLTGIFLSAVLLTRSNVRPYLIVTLFFTDLIAEILAGTSPAVSLVYATSLAGDATLGAWLLIRFVGEPITFRKTKDVIGFMLLAVFLSNALMSVVAASAAKIYLGVPFLSSWFWWFSSDGVGSLLVTPFIMSLAYSLRTRFKEFKVNQLIEGAVLLVLMAFLVNYAFSNFIDDSRFILLLNVFTFPFLIFASLRYGVTGTVTTSVILAVIILYHTISGRFAHFGFSSHLNTIILVQIYIAMLTVPSLLLASLTAERKKSEETITGQHSRLTTVLDSLDALVYVTDFFTHEVLFINKYGKVLFGDITGKKCWETIQNGQDGPCNFCSNEKLLTPEGEPSGIYRWEFRNTRTGQWFECRDSAIKWAKGQLVRMEIATDITERREVEDKIRLQSRILETMDEGVILIRVSDGIIVYVNPGFGQMFGYRPEEIIGAHISVINAPTEKTPQEMAEEIMNALDEKGDWKGEIYNVRKDGTKFWCSANVSAFQHPEHGKVWISVHTDISGLKQAENELQKSEELFRTSIENMLDAFGIYSTVREPSGRITDFRVRYVNTAACKANMMTREEQIGKTLLEILPAHRESGLLDEYRQVVETGKSLTKESLIYEDVFGGGQRLSKAVDIRVAKLGDGFVASWHDVTKKKQAEEALKKSEEKFRGIFEQSPIAIEIYNTAGNLIDANRSCLDLFGIDDLESVMGFNLFEDPNIPENARKRLSNGENIEFESVFDFELVKKARLYKTTKSGKCYLDILIVPLTTGQREIYGYLVHVRDITERKIAEETLRESEERYRRFMEISPDGIMIHNLGELIYSNKAGAEILGAANPEELVGKKIFEFIHPDQHEIVKKRLMMEKEGKVAPLIESRWVKLDGTPVDVEVTAIPIIYKGKLEIHSIVRDITERKRAEEALRENEGRLKRAHKAAHLGNWEWDLITNELYWAEENYRIHGIDPQKVKPSYEAFIKLVDPAEHEYVNKAVADALAGKKRFEIDYPVIRPDNGEKRVINSKADVIMDSAGKAVKMVGTVQDITERKRAEENMKNSLKEKEILLKEIHHRVKNNLQIISSLLYLQSKKLSDAQSLEVFNEGQNRIRSMVLVHEQLYKSGDLARINFDKYIHDIAHSLALSYGSKPITYDIHAEGVYLGVDQAIPCSLIINELISNALKHAFPQGKNGQIDIDFRIDDSNYLALTVKDNGVGFPENLDFRNTASLGLQIVNKLVTQMEGTIELHSNAGTEFIIKFPNQNKI